MNTILVVDDDRVNLIVAKRLLSSEYNVETVNSGAKAFEYLETHIPDMILLDIQMPEMDGFEVMEQLKANPDYRHIPVIYLTADRSPETESKCFDMGAVDYISKPFVPTVMHNRVRRSMELEGYRKSLEKRVVEQLQKITSLQDNIIITLANMIESRDGTTGEHVKRTSAYTRYLIDRMMEEGMYPEELTDHYADLIIKASPMHDIGKIAVPDRILQKTDRLTPEEFTAMKQHTVAGSEIIQKNFDSVAEKEYVDIASKLARYHHERVDGKGYPDGLAGSDIPLCARILAVSDVYDALTSVRSYKKALTASEALAIMEGNEGQFEKEILNAFMKDPASLEQLTLSLRKDEA